jgi:hypothetical protein
VVLKGAEEEGRRELDNCVWLTEEEETALNGSEKVVLAVAVGWVFPFTKTGEKIWGGLSRKINKINILFQRN